MLHSPKIGNTRVGFGSVSGLCDFLAFIFVIFREMRNALLTVLGLEGTASAQYVQVIDWQRNTAALTPYLTTTTTTTATPTETTTTLQQSVTTDITSDVTTADVQANSAQIARGTSECTNSSFSVTTSAILTTLPDSDSSTSTPTVTAQPTEHTSTNPGDTSANQFDKSGYIFANLSTGSDKRLPNVVTAETITTNQHMTTRTSLKHSSLVSTTTQRGEIGTVIGYLH